MNRTRYSDDNFETVTGLDGKPTRILKDKGRLRVSMRARDAVMAKSPRLESLASMTGQGERGPRGQQEGDLCMRNGWPGTLRRDADGELFCDIGRKDAKPLITDGRTNDPFALQRPGFRVPVVQDRRAVHDAYAAADAYQRNRYKCGDGEQLCEDCDGDGVDQDGNVCDSCQGKGVMPDANDDPDPTSDSEPRQTKDQGYSEYDKWISEQWRTK